VTDTRIDRQSAFTGTRPVTAALAFDVDALVRYLQGAVPGFQGPATASQFKGGQSNPTYLIEAASGSYVLRRRPPGKLLPSAHAIEREYRVLSALGKVGFPVPRVHVLVEDTSIVGTGFYLMDKVEGRISWEPHMPGTDPAERTAVYDAMGATLATLHGFEPTALGLADFGRGEGYVARQVQRWSTQYVASRTAEIPAMDRLMRWLPENLPPPQSTRIVHGDFRLDNLIIAPHAPTVRAVLDWELATLGDPVADFTYHLMQWAMPPSQSGGGTGSLIGHDLVTLGIPSITAYVSAYEARTGLEVHRHLERYLAYNFFRLAAILQGIAGRVRDGTATNENAPAMAGMVEPLADTAWRFARQSAG
jgi:aminoglycoside phosphotransferase (APT) family kinase protein